jgi:hypothetical protein
VVIVVAYVKALVIHSVFVVRMAAGLIVMPPVLHIVAIVTQAAWLIAALTVATPALVAAVRPVRRVATMFAGAAAAEHVPRVAERLALAVAAGSVLQIIAAPIVIMVVR